MFKPIRYDSGMLVKVPAATSQTILKGDALKWSSGYLAVCGTGSFQDTKFVAMEDVVTTADGQLVLAIPVDRGIRFEADCDAAVSIVDRGTYADLASKNTVNPDATSYDDFYIEELVGVAETSTKVIGFFTQKNP